MTVSTVPLRCRTLTPEDRHERLNRVNISVVEYGDEMSSKDLRTADELDEFLGDMNQEGAAQKHRLLVVQDLSTRVIEKLGSAFDIEPGIFRSHIGDYVWLNTRDPQAEIPDLESFSVKSNYFSAQYVSPRYFENQEQLNAAKAQAESFNVLRRVDHDGRFKEWSDMPGSDVGLVRSKVSLWVRPNMGSDQGWFGKHRLQNTQVHMITGRQQFYSSTQQSTMGFHSGPVTGTFIRLLASTLLWKRSHSPLTATRSRSSCFGHLTAQTRLETHHR
jgi:hypothetical protein